MSVSQSELFRMSGQLYINNDEINTPNMCYEVINAQGLDRINVGRCVLVNVSSQ